MNGKLHRAGAAGVGDGHHNVDAVHGQLAFDFFRQRHAHIQARLVNGHAVNHGVGTGKIDVFKQAGAEFGTVAALAGNHCAVKADKYRFARPDIAFQIVGKRVEGDGFGGDGIGFPAFVVGLRTQYQRADAVRVAEGKHTVARNHGNHAVCAAHQAVAGVDVAQVFVAHVFIQFGRVGEVAVVRQNDAERRANVERLRLRAAARVARSRITDVGDTGVAGQIAHIACTEHFAHHPFAFVHMEGAAFRRYNARRILSPVLQHLQAVVQKLVHGFMTDQT